MQSHAFEFSVGALLYFPSNFKREMKKKKHFQYFVEQRRKVEKFVLNKIRTTFYRSLKARFYSFE